MYIYIYIYIYDISRLRVNPLFHVLNQITKDLSKFEATYNQYFYYSICYPNMLSFISIWNNKNVGTLLHLVGFLFTKTYF